MIQADRMQSAVAMHIKSELKKHFENTYHFLSKMKDDDYSKFGYDRDDIN